MDEGQGHHIEDESSTEVGLVVKVSYSIGWAKALLTSMQSLWINEVLWSIVNTLLRVSVSLSLLSLFGVAYARPIIVTLLILSILYGLAAFLEAMLICQPLSAAWNPIANCANEIVAFVILESIGLIIDVAILVVPAIVIWRINMKPSRKLGIIVIFSLGGL